ncbi:hypothetical protein EI94DRAFT_248719 [Lactarius quietus]|nr:hypothetical protein EI94DRAFT_248719 [Lactarius quietus]
MFLLSAIAFSLGFESYVWATPIRRVTTSNVLLYNGQAPLTFTAANLNDTTSPYSTVQGSESASNYVQFLGTSIPPTPLWDSTVQDQPVLVSIDNTSVFVPGGGQPQFGFRRTELVAQQNQVGNFTVFDGQIESNKTAFHFSMQVDSTKPLNLTHEYQPVFIEPADGTHVFDIQMGTPFNSTLPANQANVFRFRSHNTSVLFQTQVDPTAWHNFAVVVDWVNLTLQLFFSLNGSPLQSVTGVEDNSSIAQGPKGQGEWHFGVLKLPLINPADSPQNQSDLVHHGIQEGTTEGMRYSGVFVESAANGITTSGTQPLPS